MPVTIRITLVLLAIAGDAALCAAASPAAAQTTAARRMNTDPACVAAADEILVEHKDAREDRIAVLVACLSTEQVYFKDGAALAALVAAGKPAVPALIAALDSQDASASEGAAIALGALGVNARGAVPALEALLRRKGRSPTLPVRAAQALGRIGEIEWLMSATAGKEDGVPQYLGVEGLGGAGPAAAPAVPLLMGLLNGDDGPTQMQAATALGKIGPAAAAAVPRLGVLSHSSLNFVRSAAGDALRRIGTPEAVEAGTSYERRKAVEDGFFKTMAVFVGRPAAALAVALGFGVLWFANRLAGSRNRWRPWLLGVPAILWIGYALWEHEMTRERANIRVDLLIVYPLLAGVTALALVCWLISLLWLRKR